MKKARHRALTPDLDLVIDVVLRVEMKKARHRALTPAPDRLQPDASPGRNEKSPS